MRSRAARLSPEPWPWSGPRVLIENADEATGLAQALALRQTGYAVAVCPGPQQSERCPLAGTEGCAVAGGADAIVSSLGLDRPESREVLEALRTRYPATPLIVEVAPGQEGEWPELLDGCDLLVAPVAADQIVAAVRNALAESAVAVEEGE